MSGECDGCGATGGACYCNEAETKRQLLEAEMSGYKKSSELLQAELAAMTNMWKQAEDQIKAKDRLIAQLDRGLAECNALIDRLIEVQKISVNKLDENQRKS